jgi:branched-chain amino acid transport system permease protein
VLIALIGGVATLWGPLIAAIVFSLLAESLRLQAPQLYLMTLGLLLILSVLYLPGGLASLRWGTLRQWRDDTQAWWKDLRDPKRREERRAQRERKASRAALARKARESVREAAKAVRP